MADAGDRGDLASLANKLRRGTIETLWRAQAGHPGRLAERRRDHGRAVLQGHARRPGEPGVGGPRPLHPLQGSRRGDLLRRPHGARLLPGRRRWPPTTSSTPCLQGHPDCTRPASTCPPARWARGSRRASAWRSAPGSTGATTCASSCSWATASCRRARSGRPPWRAPSSGSTTLVGHRRRQPASSSWATRPTIMPVEPLPDKWRAFGWNVIEIDGHDVEAIVAACEAARAVKGRPTVIVAQTIKGKGVSFMENTHLWHSALVTERAARTGAGRARAAEVAAMAEMMAHATPLARPWSTSARRTSASSSSTPTSPRLPRSNLFADAYPERFFQMGIAEQNMMGMAAGLATMGFVPFTSTFACFAAKRALDQMRISIAQPRLPVIVVGAYGGLFAGKTGKTHQAVQDVGHHAGHAQHDRRGAGRRRRGRARRSSPPPSYGGPVYLRLTRDPCPVVFDDDYDFRIGKAVVVREGSDVTIMTTGIMLGARRRGGRGAAGRGHQRPHPARAHAQAARRRGDRRRRREDRAGRDRRGAHRHRRSRRRGRRDAGRAPAHAA